MNTDLLKTLCNEYLSKLEQGNLEPGEQGTAFTVLNDMIRRLENGRKAIEHDLSIYKQLSGADRIIPGGVEVSER